MTIDETYRILESEHSEELVDKALQLVKESAILATMVRNSLVEVLTKMDVSGIFYMVTLAYLIGKHQGQWEALEELTK